jgi:NAD(P)H-dependent flavin oxidoreductase YrpB (nitropropane dioxygenase family)
MSDACDLLRIERPVIQAGMGGGLSRAELAGAVSAAGGLGTVGIMVEPNRFAAELRRTRELAGGSPFAANLLFPVLRRAHVDACIREHVPVVALFFGFDRHVVETLHAAGCTVLHQVGTVDQARRAIADGADGLIAQVEGAGGHLLATEPLDRFVPKLVDVAGGRPVIAAGGVWNRATTVAAVASGASAVSVGTRFLLTHESHAHEAYKARLLEAKSTLVTLLFGLGWHGLHRVVPNAATDRWCRDDPLGPSWVRGVNRATERLLAKMPPGGARAFVGRQTVARPFFTPVALVRGMDAAMADVTPLYAGECVTNIRSLATAADVVRELSGDR